MFLRNQSSSESNSARDSNPSPSASSQCRSSPKTPSSRLLFGWWWHAAGPSLHLQNPNPLGIHPNLHQEKHWWWEYSWEPNSSFSSSQAYDCDSLSKVFLYTHVYQQTSPRIPRTLLPFQRQLKEKMNKRLIEQYGRRGKWVIFIGRRVFDWREKLGESKS